LEETREQVMAAISRARDELDRAMSDLDRLPPLDPDKIAFAAHALSNFITITGGTVELLRERLATHEDEQVRRWLDGLLQATHMMTHTVSQLMNASAHSEMTLTFDEADLPALVLRVCDFHRRRAEPKNIRVEFRAEPGVATVWADRVALAAVLDNLLSNAVKYSPHGARVRVTVRPENESAVCSVRDEGPGLRADERKRLFQRGAKLSARPTGGETSTGYGLAVAKELMDRMGGEIWHEDAPDHGSVFFIRVPVHNEDAPSAW
jgi:signal transduction histidine kinase